MIRGIVLAAGRGRRIGVPKALLAIDGETFHRRAVSSFEGAGLDVVVVINAQVAGSLPPAFPRERRVINHDPDQPSGMLASVRLGVAEVERLGAKGAILLPVDHPLVTSADIGAVAASLEQGAVIAVAVHGGRRGHPIGISRGIMNEIATEPLGGTLRDIVRRDPGRVVEVAISQGAVVGVNLPEDLEWVKNRTFR